MYRFVKGRTDNFGLRYLLVLAAALSTKAMGALPPNNLLGPAE